MVAERGVAAGMTGQSSSPRPNQGPMSQLLVGVITAFRAIITTVEGEPNPDPRMHTFAREVSNVFDHLGQAITTIDGRLDMLDQHSNQSNQQLQQQIQQLQQGVASAAASNQGQQATTQATPKRPLAESKSVANLKVLGSDKAEFKNWNEKLINATTQTFGPTWRQFMRALNEKLDLERKVLTDAELAQIPHIGQVPNPRGANEELYYVMVEKTEGDAALGVNSGEPGEGIVSERQECSNIRRQSIMITG